MPTVLERYRQVWHSVTPAEYNRYARFYPDAWRTACDLAAGTAHSPVTVSHLIAALSPLKAWDQNITAARKVLEWERRHPAAITCLDEDAVGSLTKDAGILGARAKAALKLLWYGDLPTGQKVAAFGANIAGDHTQVTIDRHMLAMADLPGNPSALAFRDAVASVHALAAEVGELPATVQAVLWGKWRALKGRADYNTEDQ